ncbi:MAG: glycosyltransferase family 61 protein, partial [Bacteroidetes bacterium]|nr:glycosyltransferase family 61 protein [Bacteroidota bacterium]
KVLIKHGFEIIHAENYSLKEQIEIMNNTSVLMSVHGAGLTNMLFMPSGGKIIELRLAGDNHNNCYFSLASDLELDYYYLQCQPNNITEDQHTADLKLDPKQLDHFLIFLENQ